jgi:GNAT superfamily N-acetyltransferase
VDIRETGWRPWNAEFSRHHYLPDAGPMAFATAFTGFVDEEPVCFVGLSGMVVGPGRREARFCRFVTKPEWQGAGIGMRFLEYLTERELQGDGFIGRPTTSIIHSAHPALAVTLRRSPKWRQISQALHGGAKNAATGMGGHMRAVMGFRYFGEAGVLAAQRAKERS